MQGKDIKRVFPPSYCERNCEEHTARSLVGHGITFFIGHSVSVSVDLLIGKSDSAS